MRYVVDASGEYTLPNNSKREFSFANEAFEADDIPALKAAFKTFMGHKCFKAGAASFEGKVSVKREGWTVLATDKDFSGTFSTDETIVIDL